MLIRVGYEIAIEVAQTTPLYTYLSVHPDRQRDVVWTFQSQPQGTQFTDVHGNLCTRLCIEPGETVLSYDAVVRDSGKPDLIDMDAAQLSPDRLPSDCLPYLLGSRYCETDRLSKTAWQLFGHYNSGADRVRAICDFVHGHLTFSYGYARATRTALETFNERVGVCRDFTHLAIAFCRALNIPARYVNGFLGDIGVEVDPAPMDYNAWMEVYLDGQWYCFDPRHNRPRIGRIVVARGRDAGDIPLFNTFGTHLLNRFEVVTELCDDLPLHAPGPRNASLNSRRCGPAGRSPFDLGVDSTATSLL